MPLTKTCRGCLEEQPLSSFYRHAKMADGHLNYCKTCVKHRVSVHGKTPDARLQERERKRGDPRRSERNKARYRSDPEYRASLRAWADRHRADPTKRAATYATSNAIRDGKLLRPSACESCRCNCRPEAHHEDYSRPLHVVWLCTSCHRRVHQGTLCVLPF